MTRLLALLSLVALMSVASLAPRAAIAQEGTPAADCPVLTSDELESLARSTLFEAYSIDDTAPVEDVLADDYTHHFGLGETVTGADAYLEYLAMIFEAIEYETPISIDAIFVDEDDQVVIGSWTHTGTQVGDLAGYPPSDEPATFTGITILRFECGQLVEGWAETDHLSRLQQQGAIPVPEATPEA